MIELVALVLKREKQIGGRKLTKGKKKTKKKMQKKC